MKYGSRVFLMLGVALAALLACSAPAAQAVGVGQSGWSWGNPLPQGNEIDSLDFSGMRGYAAGKFGTLLRSDDGGSTWAGIPTGITQDLAEVSIIDADSLAIAGGCSVRRSDNAGVTFSRLPWTASDASCASTLVSLDFPADQAGFLLLKDGSVLATTDGGSSWSRKTALPATKATGGTATPTGISFLSATTGIAITDSGRIYRTTDGGNSWTLIVNTGQALNDVFFMDANTGYAVGKNSSVQKTTDGGASWASKTSGGSLNMTGIRCAMVDQCIITVEAGDRVVLVAQDPDPLTDTLVFTSVTPSSDKILAAAFASTTRAIAAGANGATVVSNDGGATWTPVGSRLTSTFTRIRAASNTVAYAAGQSGAAAKTVDGGKTWSNIAGPTGNNVIDIAFPTATTGYALDDNNGVSRTDNGGASWQILNPGTSSPPQAIIAPNVNTVLLIGPRGVTRSSDGGGEFNRVRGRTVNRSKLFDADVAGSAIFVYGAKIILVSTNGGKSWKKVKQPRRTALASVDFTSRKVGYALSQDGRVWKTTNGGRRWKDLLGVGNGSGVTLAFSSSSKGYLVIPNFGEDSGGYLLRTNDGGKTWNPQLVSNSQIVSIGAATGTDYALAGPNALLYTNSGGAQGAPSKVTIKTKRRKVRRRTSIKVTGKVSGAQQGEIAVVSRRYKGSAGWDSDTVTIASNGTFSTTFKVNRQAYFVAQFAGDADHTGDGSPVLTVKTRRR